jgi:hypothetical protein
MLPDALFNTLLIFPMAIMSIGLLAVSVRGLVTRRPIVFSARIFVWVFAVAVASMSIALLSLQFSPYSGGFEFMTAAQIVLFVLLIVVFWRVMQGYVVLGVTEEGFKQALLASLDELGMTYKESLAGLALDELNDVLQVSVQDWVGTAQLKMKTRANREHLQKVVNVLRGQLAATAGRSSLFIPVIYGVMGLLLLAFGVYIALDL